jgi:nucleotide-binding universal stress UspA family protein
MDVHKILVPVSGDPSDEQAVRMACTLAKRHKARVYIVHVVEVARNLPVGSPEPSAVDQGESILRRMEAVGKEEKCPVEAELLQAREAGPAVVEEAIQRQADLIIMGMEYRRRHGEFNLGATVPYVLKNAPCRVWLAREPIANGAGSP